MEESPWQLSQQHNEGEKDREEDEEGAVVLKERSLDVTQTKSARLPEPPELTLLTCGPFLLSKVSNTNTLFCEI